MNNLLIASRVFNTPLMVHPNKLDAIAGYMQQRMLGNSIPEVIEKERSAYSDGDMFVIDSVTGNRYEDSFLSQRGDEGEKPYYDQNMLINNAVAFVGVQGVLVNRKGKMRGSSDEFTSYHLIRENIETARSRGIKNVVIDFDTPGGEAIGAHECAEFIYSLRDEMNITAVISGMCCSAGYYLASACKTVNVAPTSFLGHVGTRYRRWDFTQAIEKQDITYEDFYYGDYKLEGDPTVKITDEERTRIKEEIEFHGNKFTSDVAKYRGLTQQAVKDTQALTYYGDEAVSIGFADNVMEAHDVVANIYQTINNQEDTLMSDSKKSGAPQAEHQEILSLDVAEIKLEARQEERTRISAILTSEHAEGRSTLAQHLAFNTDQSSDDVIATLKASPVEATKTGGVLDQLMANEEKPEITADASDKTGKVDTAQAARDAWTANFKKEKGIK